jgi:hypothetical protein
MSDRRFADQLAVHYGVKEDQIRQSERTRELTVNLGIRVP